jgi:hypothetical protein
VISALPRTRDRASASEIDANADGHRESRQDETQVLHLPCLR